MQIYVYYLVFAKLAKVFLICLIRDIGEILGMSYENVRYHFKALEEDGVIVIEKVNCRKMVFHINMEKAKVLVK